jgi:hypothetical protein
MAQKTLNKLQAVCDEHDVHMEYGRDYDGWIIHFCAPDNMVWCTTDGVTSAYNHENIRLAMAFLKSELAEGFRPVTSEDLI